MLLNFQIFLFEYINTAPEVLRPPAQPHQMICNGMCYHTVALTFPLLPPNASVPNIM